MEIALGFLREPSLRSARVSSFSADPRTAAMGLNDGGISGLLLFFLFGCRCELHNADIFLPVEDC